MKKRFAQCLLLLALMLLAVGCASAEEILIVDNEQITISIEKFGEDPIWGPNMTLFLENKTDKLLMFAIDNCAINGVMNDPFWAKEVMAGTVAHEEVSWMETDGNVDEVGITYLDIHFRVYDSEDWMADALLDEEYVVYPLGEDGVILSQYTPSDKDIVLFDTEEATMIITGFREDFLWGYTADVYLENKILKPLNFSVENAAVNGVTCNPLWACEVTGYNGAYSSISWAQETFDTNGITQVEEIVLSLAVSDAADWMADPLYTQQVTVTP